MRSQIHAASASSSAKSRAIRSPRTQLWCPARTIAFGRRLPAGIRSAIDLPDLDHALARAEVLGERHLVDAVVPVGERDDVRDLAAAPLVDRLIVVADDAEVRAELRQPPDETLLQRVDVLVLVDDDVADVVTDVTADRSRVLVVVLVTLEELHGEVDDLGVVEVRLLVEQPHVVAERRLALRPGRDSSRPSSSRRTLVACRKSFEWM